MPLQFRLITLTVMLLVTIPVFAEPSSPVTNTAGMTWGQLISLILTIAGTGAGVCYAAYRIIRNQSKDLKDDFNQRFYDQNEQFNQRFHDLNQRFNDLNQHFNQRFDDFNERFNDFNQRFDSRFDRIEAQLTQLNQHFIEHLKNHD